MKQPVHEFSRPLKVDRVPRGGSFEKLKADPAECKALSKRLGNVTLHGLTATLKASPWRGGGLKVEGEAVADLEQVSVVSLEAFRLIQTVPVLRYFLPDGAQTHQDDEDADPIINGHVDLGEAIAETLALELEPYPRKPGEDFADPVDVESSEVPRKESPFAQLAKIRKE